MHYARLDANFKQQVELQAGSAGKAISAKRYLYGLCRLGLTYSHDLRSWGSG